ncbi:hypothetical protein A8G00_21235 [Sphingobium sp. SA916]|nr:hypothetical protein A8G00_21235 [Sphingobium sp. SA916]
MAERFSRIIGLSNIAVVAILMASAIPSASFAEGSRSIGGVTEITVLSARGDMVSGGDALVEIQFEHAASARDIAITLNGRDITDQFVTLLGYRVQGLVTGLVEGKNELAAVQKGARGANITITNYPVHGPVFSGPQAQPFICETDRLGLGPSKPPYCEAPTKYEFLYKRVGASAAEDPFLVYDSASPPPQSEIATTVTDRGDKVPFIVRRERGVINRAIYDIAVLYQPGKPWKPWNPQAGWNGKLLMVFNAGMKPWHMQAISGTIPDVLNVTQAGTVQSMTGGEVLSRGFAVATSTISQPNNAATAAETAMMVKERLIEEYGPVRYTIGIGISGGAMIQHLIAETYPGIMDGLLPLTGLPDVWTVHVNNGAHDYPLLSRYFTEISPQLWPTRAARVAVYGGIDGNGIGPRTSFMAATGCIDRSITADPPGGASLAKTSASSVPDWIYDPVRNPAGVRCSLETANAQVFGTRTPSAWGPIERKIEHGFVNRPVDNVGVQYGLEALKRGEISPEQFVDLNLKIGGLDQDGLWSSHRTEADEPGLRNLYRSGFLVPGHQLRNVAIVHEHTYYPNDINEKAFHPLFATEMTRARLMAANGNADNLVSYIVVDDTINDADGVSVHVKPSIVSYPMRRAAFMLMDRWLAAVEADGEAGPRSEKIRRNRPVEAKDTCWTPGECPKVAINPRMVAGAPIALDIQKCGLTTINWSSYGRVRFNTDQRRRLREAFPNGVCDWSQPGVGQQPTAGTWLTYRDSAGGKQLGPAPRSRPAPR